MAMERRIAFMTKSLAASTQGKPYHEHFGVHGKYTLQQIGPSTFHFGVHRTKTFVYKFKGIPEDLETHISSFLHKHFVCIMEIHYADVIRVPVFKLVHYDSNLYINMNHLLCIHNKQYEESWSPAFTLEKDMLYLICLIISVIH